MDNVMMQLGEFQFGISTAAYQSLDWSTEYKWAKQERFGQGAAYQYTGPGDEKMSLEGVIFPEYRGGIQQIENMKAVAGAGEPMILTDGLGGVLGYWCIESIKEKKSVFAFGGVARRQDFTLEIFKFGDADAAAFDTVVGQMSAVSGVVPNVATLGNAASPIASLVDSIKSQTAGAMAGLNAARAAVGGLVLNVSEINGSINSTMSGVRQLQSAGAQLGINTSKLGANSALTSVMSAASNVTRAASKLEALSRAAGTAASLPSSAATILARVQSTGGGIASNSAVTYQKASAAFGML